jgi:hypothetical protein
LFWLVKYIIANKFVQSMAQFPFQHAILKIESKKTERALTARFSFCPETHMAKPTPAPAVGADLSALRRQITNLVAQNAVVMVQHAIDAVNDEGQYQAIKYLFEIVGLYPAAGDDESPVEDSLVKTLLHHLGLPETMTPEPGQQENNSQRPIP